MGQWNGDVTRATRWPRALLTHGDEQAGVCGYVLLLPLFRCTLLPRASLALLSVGCLRSQLVTQQQWAAWLCSPGQGV